jgi:hypothetical protein
LLLDFLLWMHKLFKARLVSHLSFSGLSVFFCNQNSSFFYLNRFIWSCSRSFPSTLNINHFFAFIIYPHVSVNQILYLGMSCSIMSLRNFHEVLWFSEYFSWLK